MNSLTALLAQVNTPTDDHGMLMSLIIWLFIGLVAGFLGSKIVNKSGEGVVIDIVLGLVGSFVGGFIIHLLGIAGPSGIIMSIVVATLGAVIVLLIYHKLVRSPRTV